MKFGSSRPPPRPNLGGPPQASNHQRGALPVQFATRLAQVRSEAVASELSGDGKPDIAAGTHLYLAPD
jgi:hypothetical protein